MMLSVQDIINIGGGAFIAAIGWFARQLYESVNRLRDDVHQIEVELPTNYVRRDEYSDTMKRIESIVEKIFAKLDTKADK
jgi:aspartate aminotransferase-like enzyme